MRDGLKSAMKDGLKPALKDGMDKPKLKGIVRVNGVDVAGTVRVPRALPRIYGVGDQTAHSFALIFANEAKVEWNAQVGSLSEEQIKLLQDIVLNPRKHNVPAWMLNHRRDFANGEDMHLSMANLRLNTRNLLKRLAALKSYRGLRNQWGLTVRGQRTKSSFRTGGKKGRYKKNKKGKK